MSAVAAGMIVPKSLKARLICSVVNPGSGWVEVPACSGFRSLVVSGFSVAVFIGFLSGFMIFFLHEVPVLSSIASPGWSQRRQGGAWEASTEGTTLLAPCRSLARGEGGEDDTKNGSEHRHTRPGKPCRKTREKKRTAKSTDLLSEAN